LLTSPDNRINRNDVLAAIYSSKDRRWRVWTARVALKVMGIERYPHLPPKNYRRMKRVLGDLCAAGQLTQRPRLQSCFTLKEVAYERVRAAGNSAGNDSRPFLER
jgi:hypothetical protein